jgi:AhpD family alkylhydroperoxidase
MPSPYRYTRPVPKKDAIGLVAAVYAQISRDFILADGPLMSLSPAPDLLAATWALVREAEVAGSAPRLHKEAIAVAVSAANHCQFCVDAHTMLVHAAGDPALAETLWRGDIPAEPAMAELVAWSKATVNPWHEASQSPGPPACAADYIGVALVTNFLNRIVDSLLHEQLLPGRLQEVSFVRRIAGRALTRSVQRHHAPGDSLTLLGDITGARPAWAGTSPIGVAYAALRETALSGSSLLSVPAREVVQQTVAAASMFSLNGLSTVLAALTPADRAGARLAILAALAPHAVSDADVAAWRSRQPTDADLVRLIAFGAFTAIDRIERGISIGALSLPTKLEAMRSSSAA